MTLLPQYQPAATPFPAAAAFPTPAPYPASPSMQDPLWMTNPWAGSYKPLPTSATVRSANTTGTVVNTLGIPVPDPSAPQDPGQLNSDIESSLAKLDTVNPDLANQLRAQYQQDPPSDSNGVFGFFKDLAGGFFKGAGEVLGVLGRTSHIVPAMFKNDTDPWYTDIGQALTGQDQTNWHEVLKQWGVPNLLAAGVGFVGDVLTDPLTYAFGAGGLMNTAQKAEVAGRAGFQAVMSKEAGLSALETAGRLAGMASPEDATTAITKLYNEMSGATGKLASTVAGMSSENANKVMAGIANYAVSDAAKTIVGDAWELAGRNYERVFSRSFKSFMSTRPWSKGGAEAFDILPGIGKVPAADTRAVLEDIISRGNMVNPRTSAAVVAQAKAAAGALGGLRFTPFIPWTSFRYYSPTLPFTTGALSKPIDAIARFAAGKSLFVRAEGLIRNGVGDMAALHLLHAQGLEALRTAPDEASRLLYSGIAEGGVIRSTFYRASEMTGGLTAAFTPGAKEFRQGLGYYFQESYKKAARATADNITRHTMYDVVPAGTSALRTESGAGQQKLFSSIEQLWQTSNRKRFNTATRETHMQFSEFLNYFGGVTGAPIRTADVTSGAFDNWFWDRADVKAALSEAAATQEGDSLVREELTAKLADMKRVLAAVPEGPKRDVILQTTAVLNKGNDLMGSYGVQSRDLGHGQLGVQRSIQPADKALAEANSAVRGTTYYFKLAGADGATEDDVVGHASQGLAGILGSTSPEPGAVEGAVSVRNPLIVTEGDILSNQPILASARKEAELGMRSTVQGILQEGGDILPGTLYSPEKWDQTLAEGTTALFKKRGGLVYDAVMWPKTGDIMLLGTEQVSPHEMLWAINPDAARIGKTDGYFPYGLTQAARDDFAGVFAGSRIVRTVPELESRLVRQITGKSLTEADSIMREEMVNIMREAGTDEKTIARYLAKDSNGDYLLPLLEVNPLKALEHYVRRVNQAVWSGLMGTVGERMNGLGKLLPEQFGRITHIEEARAVVDTSAWNQVKRAGKDVEKSVSKMLLKESKYVENQLADNSREAERVAELLHRWELGEDVDLTDINSLNPHTQRLLKATDNFQEAMQSRMAQVNKERELWTKRATDLQHTETLLREQLGITDKMQITHDNDGNAVILGYHWTQRDGVPTAVDSGTRMTGGGLHIGDRAAAEDRGKLGEGNLFGVKVEGKFLGTDKPLTDLEAHVIAGVKNGDYIAAARENGGEWRGITRASGVDDDSPLMTTLVPGVDVIRAQDLQEYTGIIYKNAVEGRTAAGNAASVLVFPDNLNKVVDLQSEVERMLNQGDLGIGTDGSLLTREGQIREAGKGAARRVYPRESVTRELTRVRDELNQLDAWAQNPYSVHDVPVRSGATEAGLPSKLPGGAVADDVASQDFGQRMLAAAGTPAPRRTHVEVAAETAARARQQLGIAVQREAKKAEQATAKLTARQTRLKRDLGEAMADLNDMKDVYENVQAKLRPAIVSDSTPGGHAFMQQVAVPGLKGMWFHTYVAQELETQLLGRPVGHFRNMWREFVLNPWKKWATYRNPGFHVRNGFGAWFNNFLGGVQTHNYEFSFRLMNARDGGKWSDKVVESPDFRRLGLHMLPGVSDIEGQMTYGDMANMLSDTGITRGSSAAVEFVESGSRQSMALHSQAARPARWADQHLRRASSTIEDYFRVAAWARGMEMTPGDLYGARAFVMMRHGDYGDLTDTENFIRDLVPFYKWMRTNVPYQLRMLATNPGYMVGVMKAQRSLYDATGLDSEEYLKSTPEWMKGSIGIPLPGSGGPGGTANVVGLDLPFMDLYKGAREYASAFLPGVLPIIESLVTKRVTFSGHDLTGEMIPLAGWAQLPGIKQVIAALPSAQLGADGRVYVPDTLENALTGIPIYGRFRNWLTGDPTRVDKRWGALTSYFAGAPIRQIDLTADEKVFYYDVLQPTLDAYKSLGYVFPTKDQLVAAGRLFQTQPLDTAAQFPTGVVGSVAA